MSKLPARLALLALALAGCATARPIQGQYADPNTIEILSEHFSENDLQMIADRMARSMADSPAFAKQDKPARVIVASITNKTSESVDLESLADKIQVALFKTGKFEIFDARARLQIAQEYQYQQSNYVDATQAHAPGKQAPADYVLTGTLASIVQQGGADERVDYKFSMIASDMTTGSVKWAEDQELRKAIEIQGISPDTSTRLKVAGFTTGAVLVAAGATALVVGTAEGFGFHFEDKPCEPPFTGTCPEKVDNQANSTLQWAGVGMMGGGVAVGLATLLLVPDGNPRLANVDLGPVDLRLASVQVGPTREGGGAVSFGGSF